MAKIVQMELAFVGACAPAPAAKMSTVDSVVSDTCADFDAMALRQGIVSCFTDPCKDCVYSGLCDADDCAQHLYAVDVKTAPTGSFDAYFERMEDRIYRSIFK